MSNLSRLALGQIYRWRPPSELRPVALAEHAASVEVRTRPPISLERAATELDLAPEQLGRWLVNGVPLLDSRAVSDHVTFALGRGRRSQINGHHAPPGRDARRR